MIIQLSVLSDILLRNKTTPRFMQHVAQKVFPGDTTETTKPNIVAFVRNMVAQEDPKSIAWAMKGLLIRRTDQHQLLRTIRGVPVLVMAGEEDRQFHIHVVKSIVDAIDGSLFKGLTKTAHLAPVEAPEAVNEEIEKFIEHVQNPKNQDLPRRLVR